MAIQENPRRLLNQPVLLHIFPSFGYGGQQARFAAIANGLGGDYHHHIVSLDGDFSAQALLADDAPVALSDYHAKKSSLASISNITHFRKLIAAINPVYLCTYNWGAMEAVMANRLGPRAPHIHFEDGFGNGETPDGQSGKRVATRRLLLNASTVVVPSHTLENIAADIWKIKPARLRYIANGVDIERLQGAPSVVSKAVSIGTLGALRPEKNHLRLIKAFLLADREKRASLTIVGDGPMREDIIGCIKENNAEDRIFLTGATATPEEAYRNFDIFALSSDTEQAPLSMMEAMAAGLPVVATNVGDIAEMISDDNRALITPAGDDDAFAYALAQLIQHPSDRAQLGAANRTKAREAFALAPMIEAYRALFEQEAQ